MRQVRDVTEPAKICIRQMRISRAKSVGCGCRFVPLSKLPAIIATAIQLSYLNLNSYKQTSTHTHKLDRNKTFKSDMIGFSVSDRFRISEKVSDSIRFVIVTSLETRLVSLLQQCKCTILYSATLAVWTYRVGQKSSCTSYTQVTKFKKQSILAQPAMYISLHIATHMEYADGLNDGLFVSKTFHIHIILLLLLLQLPGLLNNLSTNSHAVTPISWTAKMVQWFPVLALKLHPYGRI